MATVDTNQLLTITQAAKRVPQSEVALRRLVKLGRLPVVRIGRHLYLEASTLAALTRPSSDEVPNHHG